MKSAHQVHTAQHCPCVSKTTSRCQQAAFVRCSKFQSHMSNLRDSMHLPRNRMPKTSKDHHQVQSAAQTRAPLRLPCKPIGPSVTTLFGEEHKTLVLGPDPTQVVPKLPRRFLPCHHQACERDPSSPWQTSMRNLLRAELFPFLSFSTSNKKLIGTSASLLVTSALLVTRR